MVNVLVGYKWVLDEADIRVNDDLSVDFSTAKGKISDYDKNAIESACRLAEQLQGIAVGLSCGKAPVRKSFNDALSRGLDEGIWVDSGEIEPHAREAAYAIAQVAQKKDFAVVMCAEGSSDDYARQTAPRVGALLDWPVVTSVKHLELDGKTIKATRKMDDHEQIVAVELPAVISVLPEANPAPIPGLKAALAAKKKPVEELTAVDAGIALPVAEEAREVKGYASERACQILEGDSLDEIAERLVSTLKKEGVV